MDLCYRYGAYKVIAAEVVYEGDYFEYRYGTRQFLEHRPEGRKEARPLWVWALYRLENGGELFVAWTRDKAMARGEEFSDSLNKNKPWASPWLSSETSREEMAKKSVLKAPLKYAPKPVERRVEAASYSDGHAVIASKVEEGGSVKLDFDVKPLAAPVLAMQETVNRINRVGGQPQEEGAIRVSAGEAARTASASSSGSAARSAASPAAAGNGSAHRRGVLFPADEADDLEGSVELPAFR